MKKHLLPIIVFIITTTIANAQWQDTIRVNFESIANSIIKIDTAQHNNIWQIGTPHKVIFDSALSKPNAIVTDTVNYYPIKNTSSFQFTVHDSIYILNGVGVWGNAYTHFEFSQKLNTDTLRDGGYIEYSVDSGATWININNYYIWYYNNSTLFNGKPGFTGNSNGWQQKQFDIHWCNIAPQKHSAIIRFTFSSDSINTNKEGWMIDNLSYYTWVCEGINEYTNIENITISPNPANTSITITSSSNIKEIKLINILGEAVKKELIINNVKWLMDVSNVPKGIYFVQVMGENKNVANKKVIVNG